MADRPDSIPIRPDGLQLREDRQLQHHLWTLQRIGWGGFALLVAVGVSGLSGGGGPVSRQEFLAGPVVIEAPRVARMLSPTEISIVAPAEAAPVVSLDAAFLRRFEIEQVLPEPAAMRMSVDSLVMTFEADPALPHEVLLRVKPVGFGLTRYAIGTDSDSQQHLTTLVLP